VIFGTYSRNEVIDFNFCFFSGTEKNKNNIFTHEPDFSQKVCLNKLWPGNKKDTLPSVKGYKLKA